MATPGTIQRVPRGLLELLNMRASGELMSQLSPVLQPTLEAFDLYAADLFKSQRTATAVANLAGFWAISGTTGVPDGELWLLTHLSVTSSAMAAGEAYRLRLAISRSNFSTLEVSENEASASGVTQRIGLGWHFERPKVLFPRDSVGINITDITAGAHAFSVDYSYYRLTF